MLFVEAKPSEERNSGRYRPHPMCDKSRMNLVHMKAPIESGCKSILKTLPHLRPPDHRKRRQSQEPRNRWDSPRQARPGWSPGAWPGQHQPRRWLLRQRTLATTSIITSPSPNVDSPAQVVTGAGVDRNILRRSCVTSLSGFLPAQRDIIAIIIERKRKNTRAGNLCTREYSVLRFFGFGAGFTSDHPCIVGIQCVQFVGGLK